MLLLFSIFVGSVLVWLIVSLLVLYGFHKKASPPPQQEDAANLVLPPEIMKADIGEPSIEQLLQHPNIKAWFILDDQGEVVRKSDDEVDDLEDPFFKFVKWTHTEAIDLKLADIQIMKEDKEQRTMVISFPHSEDKDYYLLLYLDPVKHEWLHSKLNELNWNDLRKMIEGNVTNEESH